jgi:phospholysine phosphohistidine inorganic pyrophosphate phosphatase
MAILFDLDGVFYQGDRPIPGAADVAAWARDKAIPHLFLTNTTSRPRKALVEKLSGFGIRVDQDHILTPPVAAVRWCQRELPNQKVALFVPEHTLDEFRALPQAGQHIESVSAVIVGDLGRGWTFDVLNRAFRLLMRAPQPRLLALGMTRYWQSPDGLQLDVAPFVVGLSYAAGLEPVVLGKPAQSFYQTAIDLLKVDQQRIVMVGDDIRGDIDGAQQCGLRGVLVRTGKFREEDLELGIEPNAVIDSVADFPQWYESDTLT